MRQLLKYGIFALVGLTAALAAGTIPSTRAFAAGDKVVVGDVAPIALFWSDFIASKKGFYAKEGIDANTLYVGSVGAAVQQLIGNNLDVVYTTCETLIRAVDKGADVTIVGETVAKWPYSIMTSKDIKTVQELKGKKIILPTPRQDVAIIWNQWIVDQGMKVSDVDQVFDGATPNRYAALAAGAVQAATVSQPFDFRAMKEGYNQLVDLSFYPKQYSFVCAGVRKAWLKENPDRARRYLKAEVEASEWLNDPKNKEEAIDILQAVSKQDRALITETYDYYFTKAHPYSVDLSVPMDGMNNLVNTLKSMGEIKSTSTPAEFMDLSYLPK